MRKTTDKKIRQKIHDVTLVSACMRLCLYRQRTRQKATKDIKNGVIFTSTKATAKEAAADPLTTCKMLQNETPCRGF
jgi:Ulp1 family protease